MLFFKNGKVERSKVACDGAHAARELGFAEVIEGPGTGAGLAELIDEREVRDRPAFVHPAHALPPCPPCRTEGWPRGLGQHRHGGDGDRGDDEHEQAVLADLAAPFVSAPPEFVAGIPTG